MGIDEIADKINQLDRSVIFLGDGVEVYQDQLKTLMKVPYSFAPLHLSKQRAGAIGALGVIYFKKGLVEDADLHRPTYLRLSQAERELAEKQQKQ